MSDLWLLGGQSNMEGCGNIIDVEEPHESVRSFVHGDEWKTAQEPLHNLVDSNDSFHWPCPPEELEAARAWSRENPRTRGSGCGLPFAKAINASTGAAIDLLPVAHGGTSMQQWSPELKSQGSASLFGAMLRRTKLALETSPESKLKGVLWYQGESDCNPTDAAVYTDRMIALIDYWRKDLDSPTLPFYIVQLAYMCAPTTTDPEGQRAWTSVREQQRLLPTYVPNLGVAPAIDLEIDDGIHIGTPGFKRLGKRLANLVLADVYGKTAPTPIDIASVKHEGDHLRASFKGVNGKLVAPDPAGRVPGFSLQKGDWNNEAAFFKVIVDAKKPTDVLLYLNAELDPEQKLTYGYGFFPFCQLVDEADMAVPAFGPVAIG